MAFQLDDPTSYVFYGIAVALGLSVFTFFDRFSYYSCNDPVDHAWNEPGLMPGESRLGRTARPPLAREFAVFRVPGQDELAARVVATEGQYVEVESPTGEVLIDDGKKIPEEKENRRRQTDMGFPKILVPRGCAVLLVDSRSRGGSAARDSRMLGPVELLSMSYVFPPKVEKKEPRGK